MNNSDFSWKARVPPFDALENLKNAAIECGTKLTKTSGTILYPARTRSIFFVLTGAIDVIQQEPYRTLDVLIATLPLGMVELHYPKIDLGYKLKSNSEVIEIKHSEWEAFLSNNNLKDDIIMVLIYLSFSFLVQIEEVFTQENTETINHLIYRLDKINNEVSTHSNISLSQFILERTNLSRSLVMKTLSDLRNEGYIELKNGRLIKILKEL